MIIYYRGLELEVDGYHQPEEASSLEHPGCYEDYFIESVEWNGFEVTPIFSQLDLISELETLVLKQIKKEDYV